MKKRIQEVKHAIMYMAAQIGIEENLKKVFSIYEQNFPNADDESIIRSNLVKIAIQQGCLVELQTAFEFYDKLPKKRMTEEETRANILKKAAVLGVPKEDVIAIFNEFDALLKTATDEKQRQQIAHMGAAKIHRLLMVRGPLVMDGIEIIPAQKDFDISELESNKFTKID